eukprot:TRINITY_DN17617_c0_g1_i1.p1 TRINITY_DN17617_c0_g1~~TRINITY_DN17617_c0_g1_i1.p1  ORF type:complete len:529 (-),score=105.74 TRINITY_DN17617_c0_g1_i1:56-1642(-)
MAPQLRLAAVLMSLALAGASVPCTSPNISSLPFCDPTLPTAQRVQDLLNRMTLQEKLPQLKGGIGGGITPAVPRLSIPEYQYHSEGLHGVRDTCKIGPKGSPVYATMFPQVTAMAATGNMSLVKAMAAQMGDEARAMNNYLDGTVETKGGGLNYYGPTMNVVRDPRWGRAQESVSEDPWLNGAYSSAFVRGFQGDSDGVEFTKIAACCKHFYAYSLEDADGFTRHDFNAQVSARDLSETYLPAFQACVAAKPEQVMCSYNAVNGVPTCLDGAAQNGLLRDQLGWSGLIVSDCDAIGDAYKQHHYASNNSQAVAEGIRGGCDQNCGGTYNPTNIQAALSEGLMTEGELDVALGRALRMRFNLGLFDPATHNPYTKIDASVLNDATGKALAASAAVQSVVLLKNTPNQTSTLPLRVEGLKGKTVAIIGPTADDAAVMMGGKNDYCPEQTVTLFQGLQTYCNGTGVTVVTDTGSDLSKAARLARKSDVVLAAMGGVLAGEANDRTAITLPEDQTKLLDLSLIHISEPTRPY